MHRVRIAVLAFLFPLVVSTMGLAQTEKDKSSTEAAAAFKLGVEFYKNERFSEAATEFRNAHQLKANWKLLYNIGQAEAAAGRSGLALQTFEEYLTNGGDQIDVDRRTEVMNEIDRLRKLVGMLNVEGPEGAIVYVDDMERDHIPLVGEILVSAGVVHEVLVKKDDMVMMERQVRLSGGQSKTLNISKPSSPPPPALTEPTEPMAEPSEPPLTDNRLRTSGWILTGTGAAALLGGSIAGGVAISKDKQLEGDCEPDGSCPDSAKKTWDSAKAGALASTILLTAGGVLTVTGIVFLMADKKKQESTRVSVLPQLSDTFCGIQVQGRF